MDLKQERRSPLTIRWYTARLEKLEQETPARTLDQLTRPVLQQWLLDIMEAERADAYVENCWRALRGFLGWARRRGYEWHPSLLDVEGRFSLRRPNLGDQHPVPYTAEEVQKLLAWPVARRDRLLIRLALQTGLRLSELASIKLEDFEVRAGLRGATLYVFGKRSKERWVPLTDTLLKEMNGYVREDRARVPERELFISRQRRPLSALGIRSLFVRLGKETGIHVHAHRFRHTFATEYLRRNRNDIEGLRQLMGHEDYKTLRAYLHLVSREDMVSGWAERAPFEEASEERHGRPRGRESGRAVPPRV